MLLENNVELRQSIPPTPHWWFYPELCVGTRAALTTRELEWLEPWGKPEK